MREWNVRFEINRPEVAFTEDHAEQVMDGLASYGPSVSYGRHTLSARFCVEADSSQRAHQSGLRLFRSALQKTGVRIPVDWPIECEIMAAEDFDRVLAEPNVPELVGVHEVARMLDVSKQRASQLAKNPEFPKPVVTLASGPVWRKVAIARHVFRIWDRRPGRKSKKALVVS